MASWPTKICRTGRPPLHLHRNSAARQQGPEPPFGWAFGAQRSYAPSGLVGRFCTKTAARNKREPRKRLALRASGFGESRSLPSAGWLIFSPLANSLVGLAGIPPDRKAGPPLERLWTYRHEGAMVRYLQSWIDQLRWQRLPPISKTRPNVSGSARRNPELLPHQSTFRGFGSHQRKHQKPFLEAAAATKISLPVAQSTAHDGHKNRIYRSSESSRPPSNSCAEPFILVRS